MKKLFLIAIAIMCTTPFYAQKTKKEKKKSSKVEIVSPKTANETISYALGANIADGLKQNSEQQGIIIDWDWLIKGLQETAKGANQFDEGKMKEAFEKLDSILRENQKLKAQNQKDFLENNKKKDGIVTTPSGLQYEVITMGNGLKPTAEDSVKVQYEGTTIDGKVFDSSYKRGEPVTFLLKDVIRGWTEGLQLMPVGSKFKFYIPSELAYGEGGAGNMIEPFATLIFVVELLEVIPQKSNAAYDAVDIKP